MIWEQFWASHLLLIVLQYPPFSNLQRCFSFWKVRLTITVYGSVRVKETRCLMSGGKEYVKPGLPGLSLRFSAFRMKPWRSKPTRRSFKVLWEKPASLKSCWKSLGFPSLSTVRICLCEWLTEVAH